MKSSLLAIATCVLLAAPLYSQAPETTTTSVAKNPVYQKNCAKCHGGNAEGRHLGGPSLLSEKVRTASSEDLRNIILNGKGHMPKYSGKLTTDEINTLVDEINAINRK